MDVESANNTGSTQNANYFDDLNYPYNTGPDGPGNCCGFFQPSIALGNAFRTVNGLPRLNGEEFTSADELKHDFLLESSDADAIDFVNDFKLNLFNQEIYVFTPKGDLRVLPTGATILDFAYDIHTDIGASCIGAKVNNRLMPLSYELQNGDQLEIITSSKQRPKDEWLRFVVTARAKSKIKSSLDERL